VRADVTARHPRILAARAARDAAQAAAGAAGVAWIPEPELHFGWGRFPSDEDFVEAGASIPIPLFDRRRSEAAGARAAAERAERELDDVEARLDADAAAAFARWNAARTRATDYREHVLRAAEESMALAMEGYQAGRLSFLDLLDALRTVADAQTSDLEIAGERDDAEAALSALSPLALETPEGESR
jgi:cobalt-zinc-cadmium efflux system outer membrane protein